MKKTIPNNRTSDVAALPAIVLLVILLAASVVSLIRNIPSGGSDWDLPTGSAGTCAVVRLDGRVEQISGIEVESYGDDVTFGRDGETWTVSNTDVIIVEDADTYEPAPKQRPRNVVMHLDDENCVTATVYEVLDNPDCVESPGKILISDDRIYRTAESIIEPLMDTEHERKEAS